MDKEILKISNLSYRYSDAKDNEFVLKNINYSFKAGKVYANNGKSGSGKTTLLSLISGLESNYQGSIKFLDKELKDMITEKLLVMKTRKIVSLKPIEDRFKEVISRYMTRAREVRLK